MTSCSKVLVLVAEEKNATLSVSTDGVTQVLRSINQVLPAKDGDLTTRHNFACQLMMALSRGIGEHTYDGVVIFAKAPMMGELRSVRTGLVSRALIAEVVGEPSEGSLGPSLRAAQARVQPEL